jgi:hypothetical protein
MGLVVGELTTKMTGEPLSGWRGKAKITRMIDVRPFEIMGMFFAIFAGPRRQPPSIYLPLTKWPTCFPPSSYLKLENYGATPPELGKTGRHQLREDRELASPVTLRASSSAPSRVCLCRHRAPPCIIRTTWSSIDIECVFVGIQLRPIQNAFALTPPGFGPSRGSRHRGLDRRSKTWLPCHRRLLVGDELVSVPSEEPPPSSRVLDDGGSAAELLRTTCPCSD